MMVDIICLINGPYDLVQRAEGPLERGSADVLLTITIQKDDTQLLPGDYYIVTDNNGMS